MALIDIKWKPTNRELRVFAALCLFFFGLLGAWMASRDGSPTVVTTLWAVALVTGIPGLVFPALLRPVYLLWMALAFPIGWVVSHCILAVVYFGLLAPIGLLMRLTGHDPLAIGKNRREESYWSERPTDIVSERYFRQF